MNPKIDHLIRTYPNLIRDIADAIPGLGLSMYPRRQDVGHRFVHSVGNMRKLVVFMTTMSYDRNGWYNVINDIQKAGIYTDVTPVMNPYDAGAVCEDKSYKIAICTPEEKEILLKNGWAIGNIIVSVPNMDKATALKGLVRAWIATWIK